MRPAPKAKALKPVRLQVESLEERLALAWAGVPPTTITPPRSFTSLTLNSAGDAARSASIASTEIDWYRFTAINGGSYVLEATTPGGNLDPVIGLFTSSGQRLGYNDDIGDTDTDSRFSITLSAGQRYFFGVTNYTGTPAGSYSLRIDGPGTGGGGGDGGGGGASDDAYENNDTMATAHDLGTLSAATTLNGLQLRDSADWFRFTTTGVGGAGHSVSLSFLHSQGDVDVKLLSASGSQLRLSDSAANGESLSLSGLAAGTYYVQVYGYRGAQNPNYSLTITPPTSDGGGGGGGGGTGNRVLYLNFDGATMSRADLVRWSSGQWDPDGLDSDRNGITVQRFLNGRNDRETIITQIMSMVQADLNAYGVTVRRHTGLAVEGVGATTIFLGQSTLTDGGVHIACDVDIGNNNRTDIAFVGNENWGSANDTAIALADVTLHEAGHTWGLWHVSSGSAIESMGLRYNTDQSVWVQNTRFLDQTFQAYSAGGFAHGPGSLNTHRTMLSAFGGGSGGSGGGASGNLAADHHDEHGEQHDCWSGRRHGVAPVEGGEGSAQVGLFLHRNGSPTATIAHRTEPKATPAETRRFVRQEAVRMLAQETQPTRSARREVQQIDSLFASLSASFTL